MPPIGPEFTLKRGEWWRIVEAYRGVYRKPTLRALPALLNFSVCPLSVVDPFSFEMLEYYNALGGIGHIRTPAEYDSLPAIWLDVVRCLRAEFASIDKELSSGQVA